MKKDLHEYKRKYHAFRHHAWAGLGFLSVVTAIRLILYDSVNFLDLLIVVLIIYIVVALLLTYRYRAGLDAEEKVVTHIVKPSKETVDLEKEKMRTEIEKERQKIEKKKAKAEIKKAKKKK